MRRRGRVALLLAALSFLLGLVLIGVGSVVLARDSMDKINGFVRVSVSEQPQQVRFERAREYVAYLETPGSGDKKAGLQLVVRQGSSPPLRIYLYDTGHTLRYDTRTTHGEGSYHFTIPRAGTYDVLARGVDAPRGTRVAFGDALIRSSTAGAALVIVGVVLVLAAVVLLVVGLARRRRHNRELDDFDKHGYSPR